MNAVWSRCIVVAALLCSAKLAIADFVLITEEEARRPRLTMRSGQLPPPGIAVFGPSADAPTDSPVTFVVKFSARGGAAVNMDSVIVTYVVPQSTGASAVTSKFRFTLNILMLRE